MLIDTFSVIKLFFQLVKDNDNTYNPSAFIESLPDTGIGEITFHGRGGLEASSYEIKQSPQFTAMQNYAVERIKHDSAEEAHILNESLPQQFFEKTAGELVK